MTWTYNCMFLQADKNSHHCHLQMDSSQCCMELVLFVEELHEVQDRERECHMLVLVHQLTKTQQHRGTMTGGE